MNLKQLTDIIEETGRDLLGDNYGFCNVTCESSVFSTGSTERTHTAIVWDTDKTYHRVSCKDHTLLPALLRAKLQPATLIEL
jgi:hypothetical protein